MDSNEVKELTKKAISNWANAGDFDLENYGYCLESYLYNLDSSTGEVTSISYVRFTPGGDEEKCVYVENKGDGVYKRSVIIWPNVDNQELAQGYLCGDVFNMKLDLETIDPDFSLDKVKLYNIYSNDPCVIKPDDFDINKREYYGVYRIKAFTPKENYYKWTVDSIEIEIDADRRVAYYEDLNLYKIYPNDGDECVGEVRILDNCIVSIDYTDGSIHIDYFDGYKEDFFLKSIVNSKIDCISDCNYCMESDINSSDPEDEMIYHYDNDGLIKDATHHKVRNNESRYEGVYRVEEYQSNDGWPNSEKFYRSEYASVYPTGVTPNIENFHYKIGKLWNYDKAEFDNEGMYLFSRNVFVIGDTSRKQLIKDLIVCPDDLMLLT